jgi:hypothetical protein
MVESTKGIINLIISEKTKSIKKETRIKIQKLV